MDSKLGGTTPAASANHNRDYEDFEPPLEWVKDESSDTLLVFLPGLCFTLFSIRMFIN